MKKVLLSTAAIAGLAMVATPAAAQVSLELGGHFKGYGEYVDQDEADTAALGDETQVYCAWYCGDVGIIDHVREGRSCQVCV